MIDTHCHLTYDGLHERVEEVLAQAGAAGVDRMISVGTSPPDAHRAAELARRFPQVYATVGLHPHHAAECLERAELALALRTLAQEEKVVALGEMGLDWHYPTPSREIQQQALRWQLELAAELGQRKSTGQPWPLIIHNREATEDVLALLRGSGIEPQRFVFHCFTGTPGELDAILEFGAMVSFTGIVTFKNARALAESTQRVPLERMMVETDSPYLTPEPWRKVKVNEPRYVRDTAKFLAALRGMDESAFVQTMDANAVRFFGLPKA